MNAIFAMHREEVTLHMRLGRPRPKCQWWGGEVSVGNTATHLTNCSHAHLTIYLHIHQSWLHHREAYNQWKRSFASMETGWSARIQGPPYMWQASEVYGISSESWSCVYHKPIYQVFWVQHEAPDPTDDDLSIPPCNNKVHTSAAQALSSRLKYKDDFRVSVAWELSLWAPSAILLHLSILLQWLLHDDGLRAMGEKVAELKPLFVYYTRQHVHVHKVLCGVLYPKAHYKFYNQFQKKKKPWDTHANWWWNWCQTVNRTICTLTRPDCWLSNSQLQTVWHSIISINEVCFILN